MKSPLGKLRRFALHKNNKPHSHSPTQLDDLAQAAQDMQHIRDCYDSLLSAAAATANSAYEFSESLREMGACLLEKTALHEDEESGRVLKMLGKVQFELQKLVDSYRSHIFLTITNPSESLLSELHTVEEMKRQCDEKRNVYEYMMAQQKEGGRPKGGKSESFNFQQLKTAHDEYDEQATLCAFRLKSLKQGQSRTLLTQAARHHAAQLNFFQKGLKSLETVDQELRLFAEQQHIEYHISGLDDEEDCGEGDNSYVANAGGELSFDYRPYKQGFDVPTSRNSTEVIMEKDQGDCHTFGRDHRAGSHSAPISADKKSNPAEKERQMHPSTTWKFNTYVLPTPVDVKSSVSPKANSSDSHTGPPSLGIHTHNLWHSSPLEQKNHGKSLGDNYLSEPSVPKVQSVSRGSNNNNACTHLPPPLLEGSSVPHRDSSGVPDGQRAQRQAFSGPLTNKPSSTKPVISASGPLSSSVSQLVSGTTSGVPSSSPRVSPTASPPLVSSPRISELHELPRPPGSLAAKATKSAGLVGHSAPLVPRNQDFSATGKIAAGTPIFASPLPIPPLVVPRSFSIPSSSQRVMAFHVAKLSETPQTSGKTEGIASPPLTPISLSNTKP